MDPVAAEMSNSRRMCFLIAFDVNRNPLLERRPQGQKVRPLADFGVRKTDILAQSSDGRWMGFQAVIDLCRKSRLESTSQGQRLCFPMFGVRRRHLLAACSLNGRRMWSLGVMTVHSRLVRLVSIVLNGSNRSQHLYAPVHRLACPCPPPPFISIA